MSIHRETRGKNAGKWYYRIRVMENGRRRNKQSEYFRDEATAKREEKKALKARDKGEIGLADRESRTLNDVFPEYQKHYSGRIKISTKYFKDAKFHNHILPKLGCKKLVTLSAKDILDFQDYLYALRHTYNHLLTIYGELNRFLKYLTIVGYIDKNPIDIVTPLKNSSSCTPPRQLTYWTVEEFERFIEAIDGAIYKCLFLVAYALGCRPGELTVLTWKDIVWEKRLISINKTNMAKYYKGDPNPQQPKNNESIRFVEVPPTIIDILRKRQEEIKQVVGYRVDDYIFSLTGKKPISDQTIRRHMRRAEEIAGVPHIRVYDLRSSGAMLCFELGLDVKSVANRLGHKDTSTTHNFYTRAVKGKNEEIAQKMDDIFKKCS